MSIRTYIDNAPQTKIVGAITSGATTFPVVSLAGFPATFPYTVTLGLGTASAEQILVTDAVGTNVTVTRNFNGQGAFSHPDGETFEHTAVAKDYRDANAHVSASSGVHGVTGDLVGTTDVQTLSNKTLDAPAVTGGMTVTGAVDADSITGTAAEATAGPGTVTMFAGAAAPAGWLLCDGSAVSRSTFAALFTVVGTKFGAGDGSTTFNLPNLAGRFPVGPGGTVGATLGASGGAATHTHDSGTYAAASHTHASAAHTHGLGNGYAMVHIESGNLNMNRSAAPTFTGNRQINNIAVNSGGGQQSNNVGSAGSTNLGGSTDSTTPGSTGASAPDVTGTSGSSSSVPPYTAINFIIKS